MARGDRCAFVVAGLLALVPLGGCEKSFDDRYDEAEKKLRSQAASIDQEMAVKASEAAMAGTVALTPAPASSPAALADRNPRP